MSRMKPQPVKKANPFASLGMVKKAKSVPQTRNVAAAKPAMPLPPSGFRKGGSTKRKMSKKY